MDSKVPAVRLWDAPCHHRTLVLVGEPAGSHHQVMTEGIGNRQIEQETEPGVGQAKGVQVEVAAVSTGAARWETSRRKLRQSKPRVLAFSRRRQ